MGPLAVAAYAQVQARARALYATLLSPETRLLLENAADFDAFLSVLSKTAYAPHLQIERRLLTPRRTVYQLRWHLADMYQKLIPLTPDPASQLLRQLWLRYEVDNLKAILRGIEIGASWDQVLHLLSPMEAYVTLSLDDMRRMVRSGSILRAIERTRHTPYYDTLAHAVERYIAEQNLFPLEVALDLDHRRRVWGAIRELKGEDRAQALRLAGTALDVDNLLWAIRYRVYHHLSEEEIINYTLPFSYQVSDAEIRAIATGEDIGEIVRRAYPSLAGLEDLATGAQPGRWLMDLENVLHRHLVDLCHRTFGMPPFHLGYPLAYLMLCEYEIQALTTMVERLASPARGVR